jgi:hypothetical protein
LVKVKIYVEGGGRTDEARARCRQAFSAFFESAGLAGRRPGTVPCGGRPRAYEAFATAVRSTRTGELPLLLVDAEDAVRPGHTVWQHLKARDGWERPRGATDDQAFLMVQVMETWVLADRDALRRYFGAALRGKHLPAWADLEAVPKAQVLESLDAATTGCPRRYAKGRISFELVGLVDASKVEAACPHASRLLSRLRSV